MLEAKIADTPLTDGIVQQVWGTLRTRWLPATIVFSVLMVGATVYALVREREYTTETWILVEDSPSVSPVATAYDRPSIPINDEGVETELVQAKSAPMIAQAVKQFPELMRYKGKSISTQKAIDLVSENLSIQQDGDSDVLVVSYTDTDPDRAKAFLDALGSAYVNASLETTQSQASNATVFIERKLPAAEQALGKSSSAVREFRERYKIVDPSRYSEAISQRMLELESQAQASETGLNQTRRRVETLRTQAQVTGKAPDLALFNTILSQNSSYRALATDLQKIETRLALNRVRFREDSPIVRSLVDERDSLRQLLRERARVILGKAGVARIPDSSLPVRDIDNPDSNNSNFSNDDTATLDAQVSESQSLQTGLSEKLLAAEVDLEARTAQYDNLLQDLQEIRVRFEQLPKLQQTYSELQRQARLDSMRLDQLLEKLQELRIAAAEDVSPWRVIQPPVIPDKPDSPGTEGYILFGLLASSFAAVGTAILLERIDSHVQNVREVKALTRMTLLGTIPYIDHRKFSDPDVTFDNTLYSCFPFREPLRSLAVKLQSLDSENKVSTVAFTSATPKEGKTTIVFNLGRTLAELGLKVLLVDADLRRSTLHHKAQCPNELGLTILVSTDRPWDEFICNAGIENLDVMPAGPSPDNPLSILSSEKMARLLRGWTELYDYILIDTPPILGIADAQSLVSRVDTTIFISGIGVATKSDMRRAMELVEATPKKFLGVVVNLLKNTEDDYLIYTSQLNSIEELSENLDNGNVNRSSYRGENNTSNLRQR